MPRLKGRGAIVGLIWLAVMGIIARVAIHHWELPHTEATGVFFVIGLLGVALSFFVLGNKSPQ